MLAQVRAALSETLDGLNFERRITGVIIGPSTVQFVPLQLINEAHVLLPAGSSIVLRLFDYGTDDQCRAETARKLRALLEFLLRLMSSPATQWNTFYDELWQPEFMQRLRDPFESHGTLYASQDKHLEKRDLPTFLLSLPAEDLSENDFELCYHFLTASSCLLGSSQQQLLDRLNYGLRQDQVTVEIGLQLTDCKPTEQLLVRLQRMFARVQATDRRDAIQFPLKFKITTLWFGMNAFQPPFNMQVLKDLASFCGACVQNSLTNQLGNQQEDWAASLDDIPPRVLLDSSARSLDLSWLTLTRQHFSSVCSAIRATDSIRQVSFRRRYADPRIHELELKELWAWIAFGILHQDSESDIERLDLSGLVGSDECMAIVSRILESPHPGKELVVAIDPAMEPIIRSKGVGLPESNRLFVSLHAKPQLSRRPYDPSAVVFGMLSGSITSAMQWEVLAKLNDGWVCILVPAHGIAWVSTDSIVAEIHKRSTVSSGNPIRSKSCLISLEWTYSRHQDATRLLPMIGHSLTSLNVAEMAISSSLFDSILHWCPHLKDFKSDGNDSACVLLLLKAYQDGWCRIKRLTIGLDASNQHDYIKEVAQLVADPSVKALRQLRIDFQGDAMSALDVLIAACHVNRNLELLTVQAFDFSRRKQVQEKLRVLDNQTLAIRTPSAVKRAFLSVVKYQRATCHGQSYDRFDSLVLSHIFQFAGSPIRRKVEVL